MIARKRLDVGARDIAFGLLACAGLAPRPAAHDRAGRTLLSAREDALVCLSVRSALDLLLTELKWSAGDEVLVSAITIPDIPRILREHGLRAIPVDVDAATLAVDEAALNRAVTSRTRAIIVAHLFGGRLDLTRLLQWAGERRIAVWEDCAQSYAADAFHGHEASDVRFFSFGTIKTATAFGAGVVLVRDRELLQRLVLRQDRWSMQKTGEYAKRLLRYGAFLPLQSRWAYGALFWFLARIGRDPDAAIIAFGKGFGGGHFFQKIRRRPCAALRRMLDWRLSTYDSERLRARAAAAGMLVSALRSVRPIGVAVSHHTHWLFPLCVGNGKALMARLQAAGFDATEANSSMHALPEEAGIGAPTARAAMRQVLYIPAYAGMKESELIRLAAIVNAHAQPPTLD